MNFVLLLTAPLFCGGFLLAASVPATPPPKNLYSANRKPIIDTKARLPLVFEPNVGQASGDVQWISRTLDGTLLVKPAAITLVVRGGDTESKPVTMRLVGARPTSTPEGIDPLPSYSNYFVGSDRSQWRTRVPHYSKLKYKNVYPGIDLLYYGNDRRFEYDFVLAPGVSYSVIELAFDGADKLKVDGNGDLVIQAGGTAIRQFRPKVYQWIDGKQQPVAGGYRVSSGAHVQFALGRYDRSKPVVIDPVLQYSTYIGGTGHERGAAVAIDGSGAAYITGQTNSSDLRSAFRDQAVFRGKTDAMVAKLSSFSEAVEWISYFGGTEQDQPTGIAVDASGVVISGWTQSSDLPLRNPLQSAYAGSQDAFVAKFTPDGSALVYATYVGTACVDSASDVAVDSSGNAYITGTITNTAMTLVCPLQAVSAYQSGNAGGGGDVFVMKLPPSGSPIAYSTFVGGRGDDIGVEIAVDARGAAYVSGHTTSSNDFPLMRAIQSTNRGGRDTLLFKLAPAGNSLEYSTLLGGALDDIAFGVAVDGGGNAYVAGTTTSSDFPTVNAAQGVSRGGRFEGFVYKVNQTGSAVEYATYLGGDGSDEATDLAVDSVGSAYVVGQTDSRTFPSVGAFQQRYGEGRTDTFIARVAPNGRSFLYSTHFGGAGEETAYGIAVDAQGGVTMAGWTSSELPSARGPFNSSGVSPGDMFVARISADASVSLLGATPAQLTFAGGSGQAVASQTIALNSTGTPLTFTVGSNVPWLQVTADRTTTPATLTISVNATGLLPGAQAGEITVNAPAALNAPVRIPVTFNITAVPVIGSLSPNQIPSGQDTRITVTGTGFVSGSTVFANNASLTTTFVNATTLQATVPAVLTSGTTPLQITVRNPDAATSSAVPLQIGTAAPSIAATGIVNAATGLAGAVSPGQLVSIFGRDFGPDRPVSAAPDAAGIIGTTLSETRVLFDNIPAPILNISTNQANVIVPAAVAGRTSVQVEVEYRGRRSQPITLGIGPATPGVFTASSTGTGQAAALNENFSMNSPANPATRGSVLVLYATGVGAMNPALAEGQIVPAGSAPPTVVAPVAVDIAGVPAEVLFAGSAPGLVSGVVQINVRLAENTPAGDAVPVLLTIGTAQSRPGVTVAIR